MIRESMRAAFSGPHFFSGSGQLVAGRRNPWVRRSAESHGEVQPAALILHELGLPILVRLFLHQLSRADRLNALR